MAHTMAHTMAKGPSERQDALRLIARAARALLEEGALDADAVRSLVPAFRALSPRMHPHASADHVDAFAVARARATGVALLSARHVAVRRGRPREPMRASLEGDVAVLRGASAGEALGLVLGLSLEAAKRAHRLATRVEDLKAAFASPEEAREALDALSRGGDARSLSLYLDDVDDLDGHRLRTLIGRPGERPVHVLAGSGAWRVHDVLSPWVRRLGRKLGALGAASSAGTAGATVRPGDDSPYAGARALLAADPALHAELVAERFAAEEREGFVWVGPALVVLCEHVSDTSADRRAQEPLRSLKKARAVLVIVEDAPGLAALLAALHAAMQAASTPAVRSVTALVHGDVELRPSRLVDAASGVVVPLPNALAEAPATLTSLPAIALAPQASAGESAEAIDGEAFAIVQAALAHVDVAAADAPALALACTPPLDDRAVSRAALEVLTRCAGPPPRARARAR